MAVLVLVLAGTALIERFRDQSGSTVTPGGAAGTTQTSTAASLSPAAQVVADYVTLSLAGEWTKACHLHADPARCLRAFEGAQVTFKLVKPVTLIREENFPAEGVTGQAYTGVLVTYQQENLAEPFTKAFLVDDDTKVVAQESVTSRNSRDSLYAILSRDMK